MELPAADGVAVDLLNIIRELGSMHRNLDLGGQFAEFRIRGEKVRVAVLPDNSSLDEEENSADEYFTTDSICNDRKFRAPSLVTKKTWLCHFRH